MKFINIKSTIIVAASGLLLTVAGCKKSDFAINDNPNDITESTVDFRTVLPAALSNTATITAADWKTIQNYMGFWARSGSFQDITDEESYNFDNDFNSFVWNDLYRNTTNYNVVQQKAKAAGAGFYEGIARIMKAHNFGLLVDVYGNVPYQSALQGVGNLTPSYDKGIDIYKDLFRQIDTGITSIRSFTALTNPGLATFDLAYAGDSAKWIRLGNTIKLRMLIHAANVSSFPIAAEIAIINATGQGFLRAGETFQINPGYVTTKPNPFYRTYVASEAGTATTNSSLVKGNSYATGLNGSGNDGYYGYNGDLARLARFYTQGGNGYQGIPYGQLSSVDPDAVGSNLAGVNGPGLLPTGATSRAWIFSSVESLFLQAEAKHRGWNVSASTPLALYTAAVNESYVWLGLTTTQAGTYLTGNAGYSDVDYTYAETPAGTALTPASGPRGGLYTILSQKWFALNAIAPFEIWSDWRRTKITYGVASGYDPGPPLSVNPARSGNTPIPRRYLYPQNEYNYNAANVAGEGVITEVSPKVFWDL